MARFLHLWILTGVVLAAISCDRPKTPPPLPTPVPITPIRDAPPPVQTIPFEDGYKLGFEKGSAAAKPKSKLPPRDEVEGMAREAALGKAERNDRWIRGYTEGYLEGFQQSATGRK